MKDLGFDVNNISTPYNSDWPIENPTNSDIEAMITENYSRVKSSLMGFPGDFGNYTMRCVHDWSATTIDRDRAKTGLEYKYEFIAKLNDELGRRYEEYLEYQIMKNENRKKVDIEEIIKTYKGKEMSKEEVYQEAEIISKQLDNRWKQLKEDIENSLDEKSKEEFRWVNGLNFNDRPAEFSRKWAQRWVCKRVYELGWRAENFDDFESIYSNAGRCSNGNGDIERIGKKYQWIAFYELLARMSDNLIWIGRGYSDIEESKFNGAWQINKRNIDPTLLLRKTGYDGWKTWEKEFWWQPYVFKKLSNDIKVQISWLNNTDDLPPFKELVVVNNINDSEEWVALRGFSSWRYNNEHDEDMPAQDFWYRINSCIINKDDIKSLKEHVQGKELIDPDLIDASTNGYEGFYGEYPWHETYENTTDWVNPEDEYKDELNCKYHVSVVEYSWSKSERDESFVDSISFYMPSRKLIEDLHLESSVQSPGEWKSNGDVVFIDPSVKNEGPSYGMIRKNILMTWLDLNNLALIWLIGGEKNLYEQDSKKFNGRITYGGFFTLSDGKVEGDMWTNREKGCYVR